MSKILSLEGLEMYPKDLQFVVGSCRFKMIKVEGGTFTMGATEEQGDAARGGERPAHKVTLSDYYIGQTVVTQALWTAVMGSNPSDSKGNNLPVYNVCWDDCQTFIKKLNSMLSNELGEMRFALPTEAQWEFAARGGNKSKGYKYAGSSNIDDVAWYMNNSDYNLHPVAQKQPNELGIYDMSGNVEELCQDWYDEDYYRISPENNPHGPADGEKRVVRGGRCSAQACETRVSFREKSSTISSNSLRLCLNVKVNSRKCSKCGVENPNGFKFCGQCGTELEVNNKCPICGTTLINYSKFCPECGTQVCVKSFDKDSSPQLYYLPNALEFVVGSCRFKMNKVEGGTFTMGATYEQVDDARDEERPAHKVTLSDYYIGQTVVTQALWKTVMGNNPSYFKGDNLPMENVSWDDCQTFIQKLNSLFSNQLGGKRFALPTEAQWEFAARGGNKSKGYKYAGSDYLEDVAWLSDFDYTTHPVAKQRPNELGLYDMSGNVEEWCQDWYDEDYYRISPENNPHGPADGKWRVRRGGSYYSSFLWEFRVSYRNVSSPDERNSKTGLRLCLNVKLNSRKCLKCGFENPDSFKFCGKCGTELEANNKCSNCGTTLPSNAKFCPECGTRGRVESFDKYNPSRIDTCPEDLEFLVGSCSFKMIKVEGGTFTMGATVEQGDDAEDDERPAHKVTLSDYYIGQTEVTQAQWRAVMGWNHSEFKSDNLPVERVSWDECQTFIQKLNSLFSNQLGGKRFALPTEAEWEFAARGGNKSKGYEYAGSDYIDDVAWFSSYDCDDFLTTHPVAKLRPNELGLYDMSGNVEEWCQDWYGGYSRDAQTNPHGPAEGSYRVIRGGSWWNGFPQCRVSHRSRSDQGDKYNNLGLRLVIRRLPGLVPFKLKQRISAKSSI